MGAQPGELRVQSGRGFVAARDGEPDGAERPVDVVTAHFRVLLRATNPQKSLQASTNVDAGGGTRTPDTRIMIPLL